jgi:3-oxoacyl-[acyl-carrier protein] reductase
MMSYTATRTAVVTGGATGIGQTIARRLAAEDNHVVILDIQDGSETVDAIEDDGGSAEFRKGDVTDEESLADAYDGLELDVLVNNAAFYSPLVGDKKRFDQIDSKEWDKVMAVNTKGVFLSSKQALSHFKDDGAIVNMASNTAVSGVGGFLHYVASKAAVLGMTRAMATELGDVNIRVNAVMPGLTASEASLQADDDYWENITNQQALNCQIQPNDIAEVVTFLAGQTDGMITGQAVNVDGGLVNY